MNLLRSRCLAAAALGVSAALALLPLTPGSASASAAAPAPSPMAAAAAAAAAAGFPLSRTLPGSAAVPACTTAGSGKVLCESAIPAGAAAPRIALAGFSCAANKVARIRHEACGEFAVKITLFEAPSGKVLGTADVAVAYAATLSASSRSWDMPMVIEMTSASTALRLGTVADTAIFCRGGCVGPALWSPALRVGAVDRHTFVIRAPGSATITTTQTPEIIFTHPAAENGAPVTFSNLGPARCDSIAVKGTSGCVFSDVIAEYVLHKTGQNVNAVAAHIQTAQRTKPHHFGLIGHSPLTRSTSAAVASANRRKACGGVRVPKGMQCDEYPFAATNQGAKFFPADNSTFPVPSSQNAAEGARRVNMYRTERVLNGERYWVVILP